MSNGAIFIKLFYPGLFGLEVPSDYFLTVDGKPALLRLLRRLRPVEVLDFTNELIPDPQGKNLRRLKSSIDSPSENSMEFIAQTMSVAKERTDNTLHNLGEAKITDIPHRLTIDPVSIEGHRYFKTRDWTDMVIVHEADDIKRILPAESVFFQQVLDRFLQAYRLFTRDSRIRYFEEVQEAIHWNVGKVRFEQQEMSKSPLDRLASARNNIQFKDASINFPYGHEDLFEIEPPAATQLVFNFLKMSRPLSLFQELFLKAHEAAYYRKNPRYALVESFSATEICVTNYLNQTKLGKGVSSTKLKAYHDEVPMGYKVNVEIPLLLEKLTFQEEEVLGTLNWLRKKRNAVVHQGESVSDEEAKKAVNAAGQLFDMLVKRGIDLSSL